MNPHVKIAAVKKTDISSAEWQARIDLAATYRLIAHYGWGDVIYNHSSMRVPGEDRKFLIKRHELLYTEVTASNLVKVSMDDDLDESAGVNRPGFTLHGGVLSARPDVNCAVHVHTETGMALAGLKHGLRMVSQPAVRFFNRIGYHDYEGITEDFGERDAHQQGARQKSRTDPAQSRPAHRRQDAARGIRVDEIVARGRRYPARMEATGGELIEIPAEICEKTAHQYEHHDSGRGSADWPAYLRMLDEIDSNWRN